MCVSLCVGMHMNSNSVSMVIRRGHWIPKSGVTDGYEVPKWMLGNEAVYALNCCAISPTPKPPPQTQILSQNPQ